MHTHMRTYINTYNKLIHMRIDYTCIHTCICIAITYVCDAKSDWERGGTNYMEACKRMKHSGCTHT